MSRMKNRASVNLNQVCKDYGIRIFDYNDQTEALSRLNLLEHVSGPEASNGFAFLFKGEPVILFDGGREKTEVRYTIAHELGHIILGHLSYRNKGGKMPEYAEMEANCFAAAIIANDILAGYGEASTV